MAKIRSLPDPTAEPTIKAERAAGVLDMSVRGIYAAVERGDIPSIKVGRAVRIPTARFLERFGLSASEPSEAA